MSFFLTFGLVWSGNFLVLKYYFFLLSGLPVGGAAGSSGLCPWARTCLLHFHDDFSVMRIIMKTDVLQLYHFIQ